MFFILSSQRKEKSFHVLPHVESFVPALSVSDSCSSAEHDKYNTDCVSCQQSEVVDFNESSELKFKFAPKKAMSALLADSYSRLGLEKKVERVSECGSFLEFAHEVYETSVSEKGKLYNANFCRDRLCPMCSWRRSYKIFGQLSQIMSYIGSDYKFIFLTLTVPNCEPSELSKTIDGLMYSWHKLVSYKRFKTAVKGSFRVLEITRNKETGFYHPHFHIVLAVSKNYATSRDYIKRDEWLQMWRKACKDDSITQVDVRLIKPKHTIGAESVVLDFGHAVAEVSKYSCKSHDYIIPQDPELTDKIVSELSAALDHRRLTAYGGCFKEAYEALNLDDAEDGDLIHINEKLNPSIALLIVHYGWSAGVYSMSHTFVKYLDGKEGE